METVHDGGNKGVPSLDNIVLLLEKGVKGRRGLLCCAWFELSLYKHQGNMDNILLLKCPLWDPNELTLFSSNSSVSLYL